IFLTRNQLSRHLFWKALLPVAGGIIAACTPGPASGTPDPVVKIENSHVGDYDPNTLAGCLGCGQTFKTVVLEPVAVGASRDSVFVILRKIYSALGVEVKAESSETGELGNRQFIRTSRLGGTFLHEYINCGQSLTGPTADSYRIQLTLMSYVTVAPAGSVVKSQLSARAYDTGAGQGSTTCESTGVVEHKIKNALLAALPEKTGR
ncbi:MAG: hypothetical protein ABIW30_01655, partial [Arenimonas sp.]